MRSIFKIDVKNEYAVKGRQLEGVRKVAHLEELAEKISSLDATEIFIIDYTKSNFGLEPNYTALEIISSAVNLPITYGGGISSLNHIEKLAKHGASRFYVNSMLAQPKSNDLLKTICDEVGRQSIVAGVEYRIVNDVLIPYYNAGRDIFKSNFRDHVDHLLSHEIGEILFTCINKDGMLSGLHDELHDFVSSIKSIPKIIAGGATGPINQTSFDGVARSTSFYKELL